MSEHFAVVGDVHGHLQLALCMCARWQRELGRSFDAVFLCGDVGTFTEYGQLDSATLSHARANPCELEFLNQWATDPPAPWVDRIFLPGPDGLGLQCPVVMVHGNHEGFAHLERLAPGRPPTSPVTFADLPTVDSAGYVRLLPSGWSVVTHEGHAIAGIGGIEPGQRRARYHPMAYVDEGAVTALLAGDAVDVLLTHQGPSEVQGELGSDLLQALLDESAARLWFHGHANPNPAIVTAGTCTVIPLGDVAFGRKAVDPGLEGWCRVVLGEGRPAVVREPPPFWRDYRRSKWSTTSDGRLVAPDLARLVADKGRLP